MCYRSYVQMMVILEFCGGGNLQKALKQDARSTIRRLVRTTWSYSHYRTGHLKPR
jgi:hypothetical protein